MRSASFSRSARLALVPPVVTLATLAISACGTLLSVDSGDPSGTTTAGGDASALDAAATGDGASNGDGGCGARFCCSFDAPSPCAWSGEEGSLTDVTFAIDSQAAVSAPNALHVTTSGTVSDATRMSFVDADGMTSKASVALQLRLEAFAPGESSSVHPVEITCNGKVAIALKLKANGALVLGGGDLDDIRIVDPFPFAAFVAVRLDLEQIGADLHARVETNAAGAIVGTGQEPCSGPVQVHVGATVHGGSGAYDFRVDDVRIDW